LAVLTALISVAVLVGYSRAEARRNRRYDVAVAVPQLPTSTAQLQRGEHLAKTLGGCAECHGADFGGKLMSEDAMIRLVAPNLTAGRGSVIRDFSDRDWVRAIVHGLNRENRSLLAMPAQELGRFAAEDVAAIVAFFKTVPAVDRDLGSARLKGLGSIVIGLAGAPVFSAEKVDHQQRYTELPPPAATREYGRYLTTACRGCHGEDLRGGIVIHPGAPPSSDLSKVGTGDWSFAAFERALRKGEGRDGRKLDPAMPWGAMKDLTAEELRALWLGLSQE
jgi:cytochrome c553